MLLANIGPATTAVVSPATAYGTLGVNDSGWFATPIGMSKYTFQLVGGGTGYSVSVYGTIDPTAYLSYTQHYGSDGFEGSVPATSSGLLPAPSEQSGTGNMANPLTSTALFLYCNMPLVAVRAVLTASATPTGSVSLIGFAIP